ncbi:NADPH dehydrogenase [compost metagenome]
MNLFAFYRQIGLLEKKDFPTGKVDGRFTPWHQVHYTNRASGQVGVIILEAAAVQRFSNC